MPIINILPVTLRNKIAAGEVVERPAAAVKELIENSIDAKGTRLEIDIVKAGKRLIKVSDNGIGMDKEDALLAFERYATSKIKNEEDLYNIRTMGFRGEALASIASVSKVRLTTAMQDESGICIELIGGKIKETKDCPSIGTIIEVKDLFFNMPARRKFLKSDSTENYHITDITTKEAMSNYQTAFVLRIDGSCVLNLPSAFSLRERLMQIFGKEFVDDLIETELKDDQISIKAFLGKITNLKNNKNNQFLFINNRPVKDNSVSYAVYKAYEDLIPKDKHPVFFLFMEIDPRKVDFNVHPTKREVRFQDKSEVFNFVYQVVKEALKNDVVELHKADAYLSSKETTAALQNIQYCNFPQLQFPHATLISESSSLYGDLSVQSVPFLYLGDTLIAIAENGGIKIIDYHAAHERINYERLLKSGIMDSKIRLLFPQQVKLQGSEYKALLKNLALLNDLGLEIEDFGNGSLIVRSLPDFLKDADLNALLEDIASLLLNEDEGLMVKGQADKSIEPLDSIKKMLAAKLACHSSIRGNEVPDSARIAQLLKDLDLVDNPVVCPHGRPTKIFISMNELKKMFRK